MRLQLKGKRNAQVTFWAVILFAVSSAHAFTYEKGAFVPHDQLLIYAMSLAQSIDRNYNEESYTITVSVNEKDAIVRFMPKPKPTPPGWVTIDDSGLELHFKRVEGGYEYKGGLRGI